MVSIVSRLVHAEHPHELRNIGGYACLDMQELEWKSKVSALAQQCSALEKAGHHPKAEGGQSSLVTDLSAELARAYSEIEELRTANECGDESIKCLENTLAAMERHSKLSRADTSQVASAAFSKQIVQCTMAQKEAHRRLKVAARQALDYEQRLAEQATRIQELKGHAPPRPGYQSASRSLSADHGSARRRAVSLSPATHVPRSAPNRGVAVVKVRSIYQLCSCQGCTSVRAG